MPAIPTVSHGEIAVAIVTGITSFTTRCPLSASTSPARFAGIATFTASTGFATLATGARLAAIATITAFTRNCRNVNATTDRHLH